MLRSSKLFNFFPFLLYYPFSFIPIFLSTLLSSTSFLLFFVSSFTFCLFPFFSTPSAYSPVVYPYSSFILIFFCLHLWFYPILSPLFLLLLTFFDFHTFLRVYIFLFFSFLLPITFFFLPWCSTCFFIFSFFVLCTIVLGMNAVFCLLEVSIRSVATPVVAATRKTCSCQNGGMCHLKRRSCHCLPGYFGRHCERVSCKPGCLNGGHCRQPDQCVCPPHYSGPRCETRKCSTTT